MKIHLHKNATTTPAQRAFIQNNPQLSTTALAEKIGVSKTTVRRWRNRSNVFDRPHTPKQIKTVLTPLEEIKLILSRMTTLAGLDDLQGMVDSFLGIRCSRASLNRCLKRYHISKVPSLNACLPFDLKDYTGTYFYYNCIDLPSLSVSGSPLRFHTLVDCSFRVFHAGLSLSGSAFLDRYLRRFPLKVLGIVYENPVVLGHGRENSRNLLHSKQMEGISRSLGIPSFHLCTQKPETLYRLKKACSMLQTRSQGLSWDFPWTSNKDLSESIHRYNTGFKLGALRKKSPFQVMEAHYTHFPNSFSRKPSMKAAS